MAEKFSLNPLQVVILRLANRPINLLQLSLFHKLLADVLTVLMPPYFLSQFLDIPWIDIWYVRSYGSPTRSYCCSVQVDG